MEELRLKELLVDAAARLADWSFDSLASLNEGPWIEEGGSPGSDGSGLHYQIEAEVLDRFAEDGIDVLHAPVFASDGQRSLGTDLFVYRSGRVRWNRSVHRYIDGVPQLVE